MKFVLLVVTLGLAQVAGATSSHQCRVFSVVQKYDLATMKFLSATEAKTEWFEVTALPHEDPKNIEITDTKEVLGTATVWTGTLLNTKDGDVIQVHANFSLLGTTGSATLIMSLDSSVAKSSVVLETQTQSEMVLIPASLECYKN